MVFFWVLSIRGISIPLRVLSTSRMELAWAGLPVVFTLNDWEAAVKCTADAMHAANAKRKNLVMVKKVSYIVRSNGFQKKLEFFLLYQGRWLGKYSCNVTEFFLQMVKAFRLVINVYTNHPLACFLFPVPGIRPCCDERIKKKV